MSTAKYEVIIGLEIHLRLNTKSKMFCGSTNGESETPNLYTCPICLGHPGTLPQLNKEAVRLGTLLGIAVHGEIQLNTKFDRKNYFYPDLPKGYQISQYDQPIVKGGFLEIFPDDITPKHVRIERIHLEEDAAKLKHDAQGNSLVDFNRAGAPLAELVTCPDIRTAAEARVFIQELQQIARYIGVSDADMEKGHMRCDANISLRPIGDEALYPKTEIKNVNSARYIEKAIEYEIARQTELWEKHEAPQVTTTRGWDEKRGVTVEQRTKEDAADYRYFPEPDLPPLVRDSKEIDALMKELPELPAQRRERMKQEYELSYHDARILCAEPFIANFFEETISELRGWLNTTHGEEGAEKEIWKTHRQKIGRLTNGWITSEVFKLLKETGQDFSTIKFTPENFAELLTLVFEKRINSTAGQKILRVMFAEGGDPSVIMQTHNLEQTSDSGEIDGVVTRIIEENPSVVSDFKNGKEKALMFLVGQVMKATKGKVNPEVATQLLKAKIQ
ncbi:MAG: Asp-tRNA(Asn)/Glu-tRNA(Gln) amidotransferase subunit GatB [Candidatus Kerfeldbacteria bacterium]|nr:Asp-tRNA(Asn)/Glu-tRNA(Gln) amidotransferase subunit GatB [Candidatus Kerfeldbacteria bacterium]